MEAAVGDSHRVWDNEDLLSKILVGLPLSSIRLCKSVCKRWYSLITDPCFNALRSRSPNAHHPCGLILQLQHASSVFAYLPLKTSSPPTITTTSFPFNMKKSTFIEVLQSCNGLLLCYDWHDRFYVYNPSINHCKLLPLPRIWKPDGVTDYMALAFDLTLSPHYKLVYPREDSSGRRVHVEIYSSETGFWRACACTFSPLSFLNFCKRVVYWRGAIHWFSRRHVYHFSLDDIHNPHFIQFENNKNLGGLTYCLRDKLLVSPRHDCLLLAKMLPQPLLQMNVYEMNDYSSGWSIKYHVNLDSAARSFPEPIFYVLSLVLGEKEEDSFLVLEVTGVALIQYNLVSKTFHQLCDLTQIQLVKTQFCRFLYTPSLVG